MKKKLYGLMFLVSEDNDHYIVKGIVNSEYSMWQEDFNTAAQLEHSGKYHLQCGLYTTMRGVYLKNLLRVRLKALRMTVQNNQEYMEHLEDLGWSDEEIETSRKACSEVENTQCINIARTYRRILNRVDEEFECDDELLPWCVQCLEKWEKEQNVSGERNFLRSH